MISAHRHFPPVLCALILLIMSTTLSPLSVWAETEHSALWHKVRSGEHVVMIRHALAPGTGDPPEFTLDQCATQRNLSANGRDQARYIGDLFRRNGIRQARIYSSQWCRCLETARLLDLGKVEELPVLNSFFQNFANKTPQTTALAQWLRQQDLSSPVMLVTHQVNITAFTDVYPRSGEMVIVYRQPDGDFAVVGTIATD